MTLSVWNWLNCKKPKRAVCLIQQITHSEVSLLCNILKVIFSHIFISSFGYMDKLHSFK